MSKSPSPTSHSHTFLKFVQLILLPLTLAGMVACGGSSNSPKLSGGGGGGGGNGPDCTQPTPFGSSPVAQLGVGKPATSAFLDLHVGSSSLLNTVTVPYGSLRL